MRPKVFLLYQIVKNSSGNNIELGLKENHSRAYIVDQHLQNNNSVTLYDHETFYSIKSLTIRCCIAISAFAFLYA